MHEIVFHIAIAWLSVLLAFTIVMIVRARSLLDRVLAFDTATIVLVGLLGLFSIVRGVTHYLDAALVLALLAFAGTLAAIRYQRQGGPF